MKTFWEILELSALYMLLILGCINGLQHNYEKGTHFFVFAIVILVFNIKEKP